MNYRALEASVCILQLAALLLCTVAPVLGYAPLPPSPSVLIGHAASFTPY